MTLVKKTVASIRDATLLVLFAVIGISYHPVIIQISRLAGYENGTILSRYIVLLFVGVFMLSILADGLSFFKSRLINTSIVLLLLVAFSFLAAFAFFNNESILGDIKSLGIVIGAIIIGWQLAPTKRFLDVLIITFCTVTLFSGFMQILLNIGGLVIADTYLTDAKNSLGAMLSTVSIASLFLINDSKTSFVKVFGIVAFVLSLLFMLVIRSRMAFLTSVLIILFFMYSHFKRTRFLLLLFVGFLSIVIGLVISPSFYGFINDSFTAGTQGEDFTSGRLGLYQIALNVFLSNPLFGNIDGAESYGWVHNYLLLKLSDYGLLFSLPILSIYFYYIFTSVRRVLHNTGFIYFANLIMLVPEIVSLAEPTFPFGPGTVTVFNFILFGCAEKSLYLNKVGINNDLNS